MNAEVAATLRSPSVFVTDGDRSRTDSPTGTPAPESRMLAVLMWKKASDSVAWLLDYLKEVCEDGSIVVDNLERLNKDCNSLWRYLAIEDIIGRVDVRPSSTVEFS